MAQVAPVQAGPAAGQFSADALHQEISTEFGKLHKFSGQIATVAPNKLPDKQERGRLIVELGSELNVSGKDSLLVTNANGIKQAVKQAGKSLEKTTKNILLAKAQILEAVGRIELAVANGKNSLEQAFKGNVDKIITASIQIAQLGSLDDKQIALENIELLKTFNNVPSVTQALAKHATKILKIEAEVKNPTLAPFFTRAAHGGGTPPSLGQQYGASSQQHHRAPTPAQVPAYA